MKPALAIVVLAVLTACSPQPDRYQRELYAFGTEVRIDLRGAGTDAARALADDIERQLNRWNRDWYAWGDGELADVNAQLAVSTRATTTAAMAQRIVEATTMRDRSDGLFDPTVGAYVALWHFDSGVGEGQPAPARDAIARTPARALLTVAINAASGTATVTTDTPGVVVDLGGIAKGMAMAALREIINASSIDVAVIDLGGDVLVVDKHQRANLRIGIAAPRGGMPPAYLTAANGEAIVTSGDYARFRVVDGERLHHIIDPRTGRPGHGSQAVTVVATEPILADAAATALMVAGPALFHEMAEQMGVNYALMIDANGHRHSTAAMRSRLTWLTEPIETSDE
ncbi:MAG: FAD:protein FMN transferase [Pseudomonadota bacterium]